MYDGIPIRMDLNSHGRRRNRFVFPRVGKMGLVRMQDSDPDESMGEGGA